MKNEKYLEENFTGALLWCMMRDRIYFGIGARWKRKKIRRRGYGREEQMEERQRMTAALAEKISREQSRETPSEDLLETLWETLKSFSGERFETAKHLEYQYYIRGKEMFVSRKDKSITRATVNLAFARILALQKDGQPIPGPKTIGVFGASYLYPVFVALKIIPEGQLYTKRRGRPHSAHKTELES